MGRRREHLLRLLRTDLLRYVAHLLLLVPNLLIHTFFELHRGYRSTNKNTRLIFKLCKPRQIHLFLSIQLTDPDMWPLDLIFRVWWIVVIVRHRALHHYLLLNNLIICSIFSLIDLYLRLNYLIVCALPIWWLF